MLLARGRPKAVAHPARDYQYLGGVSQGWSSAFDGAIAHVISSSKVKRLHPISTPFSLPNILEESGFQTSGKETYAVSSLYVSSTHFSGHRQI